MESAHVNVIKMDIKTATPQRMIASDSSLNTYVSAFGRLQNLRKKSICNPVLKSLSEPGTFNIGTCNNNRGTCQSYDPYQMAAEACRIHCCRFLFVTIVELSCLGAAIYGFIFCKNTCILLICLTLLAIVCALIEWMRGWVWRESSPILHRPNVYESTIHRVNDDLDHEMVMIDPPGLERPQRYLIHDVEITSAYPLPPVPYPEGGGFRGNLAVAPLFDVHQIVAAICLSIIYSVGCAALIWGLVWVSFGMKNHEQCEKSKNTTDKICEGCPIEAYQLAFVYLSIHLIVMIVRILWMFTCDGIIMRSCIKFKLSEPTSNTIPIVVNPFMELPSQKSLHERISRTLKLTRATDSHVALHY